MARPDHPAISSNPERAPGRSFTDPRRPLGEKLLADADPHGGDPEVGIYGRAPEHYRTGHGLPERARCVAVLRKAEELMATGHPPGDTEHNRRAAIEVACSRCGVAIEAYDRVLDEDAEARALHDAVMDAARIGRDGS